ncbi:MAG: hypothetical protein CSB24_01180 [Deltaproteobacteria bacterium]|nr:MAG: hypothetical protein CSB24_01180 [Deltaproteobacteria bacterium]
MLTPPDKNHISFLPGDLSAANKKNQRQFRFFAPFYDPVMRYLIRPRVHKADPARHQGIWQEMIGNLRKAEILDLACGTGGLIACINQDNNYTGLDLSYEMLKKAAKRAGKKGFSGYRLICGNAESQIFPAGSFDAVVSDTALHMIPDWQGAVRAAAHSLAPQGTLSGAVPIVGIDKDFDRIWQKYADRPQFHALTEDDLAQSCRINHLDFTRFATNGGLIYFQAVKS